MLQWHLPTTESREMKRISLHPSGSTTVFGDTLREVIETAEKIGIKSLPTKSFRECNGPWCHVYVGTRPNMFPSLARESKQ